MGFVPITECVLCGAWHNHGSLIQTEDPSKTDYVCLECFERYLEEEPE